MSLFHWRKGKLQEYKIHSLYYFSHKNNFKSIIKHGILSKHQADKMGIKYYSFAEEGVQDRREARDIKLTDGEMHNIHDLVPLYLTPRTPTLFARKNEQHNFFFCVVQSFILCNDSTNFAFSDGNAGSGKTKFHYSLKKLNEIPWNVIRSDRWDGFPDGTRQRNSEFLIHSNIPVDRIWRFVVSNSKLKIELETQLKKSKIDKEVAVVQHYYF